jgi:RimJ/RimL family protein N-acetyltransferase
MNIKLGQQYVKNLIIEVIQLVRLEYLEKEDIKKIIDWNKDKSKEHLVQWAGSRTYKYPLTEEQIQKRFVEEVNKPESNTIIFKIIRNDTNEIIGTVELFQINRGKKTARIGRFLIGKPKMRGKGYGKLALYEVVDFAFNKLGLEKLDLSVYDFNKSAIKCYECVGFVKESFKERVEEFDNGTWWNSYTMSIKKENWKTRE